jgi:hypothetical protein
MFDHGQVHRHISQHQVEQRDFKRKSVLGRCIAAVQAVLEMRWVHCMRSVVWVQAWCQSVVLENPRLVQPLTNEWVGTALAISEPYHIQIAIDLSLIKTTSLRESCV